MVVYAAAAVAACGADGCECCSGGEGEPKGALEVLLPVQCDPKGQFVDMVHVCGLDLRARLRVCFEHDDSV